MTDTIDDEYRAMMVQVAKNTVIDFMGYGDDIPKKIRTYRKISHIRVMRQFTGLGLRDAKDIVEYGYALWLADRIIDGTLKVTQITP